MLGRRNLLRASLLAAGTALVGRTRASRAQDGHAHHGTATPGPAPQGPHQPVESLNGTRLPWVMKDGVKEFHLVAGEVEREFAPGMVVRCWGYNGQTPGPVIEAVEGDSVRILVTNRLPEHTSVHWHGVLLPNGMDGVGGITQPHIPPGATFAYEFTLRQHGTQMYHPHSDEMVQMAVGLMGMFVIHPKDGYARPIDRDFALMTHEWAIHPGTMRPDPAVMLDFDLFTINGKVFPAIEPLVVRTGQRVRIRFGNLSMNQHPMHLHGYAFNIVATDGGPIPESAQWPQTTVPVPVGSTRDIEFVADAPGDWALHCHKSHHTMNAMAHDVPNLLAVDQRGVQERIQALIPGYVAHGENGMAAHSDHLMHLAAPHNTLPMMWGEGPFGPVEMGGMFTILKVRDGIESYEDPGWYQHPDRTVAYRV